MSGAMQCDMSLMCLQGVMSGGDAVCHVTHVPTGGDVWGRCSVSWSLVCLQGVMSGGDIVCRVTHVPTVGDVWGRCNVSCHSCAYRG